MATFAELMNFSRASVGYYFNSVGDLVQAAVDEPRFDYTPLTGFQPGLLVEPSVTEDNRYTSVTTATYTTAGSPTVTDLSLNALGVFPGVRIATNGNTAAFLQNAVARNINVTSGVTRLIEVYYRAGTSNKFRLTLFLNTAGLSTVLTGTPGVVSGNSGTAGTASVASHTLLKDGLTWRLRLRYVPAATSDFQIRFGPNSSVVGEDIIWLAYFNNAGPHFTTPILTNGSPVTRAAETATVKDTGVWFNKDEGVFQGKFRFSYEDTNTGDQVIFFRINEAGYDTPGHTVFLGTLGSVTGRVNYTLETSVATTTVQGTATDYAQGQNLEANIGVSYDFDSFKLCFNGGTVYSGVPVGLPPDLTSYSLTFGGTAPITILSFKHYPVTADATLLQSLTV